MEMRQHKVNMETGGVRERIKTKRDRLSQVKNRHDMAGTCGQ